MLAVVLRGVVRDAAQTGAEVPRCAHDLLHAHEGRPQDSELGIYGQH